MSDVESVIGVPIVFSSEALDEMITKTRMMIAHYECVGRRMSKLEDKLSRLQAFYKTTCIMCFTLLYVYLILLIKKKKNVTKSHDTSFKKMRRAHLLLVARSSRIR